MPYAIFLIQRLNFSNFFRILINASTLTIIMTNATTPNTVQYVQNACFIFVLHVINRKPHQYTVTLTANVVLCEKKCIDCVIIKSFVSLLILSSVVYTCVVCIPVELEAELLMATSQADSVLLKI